MCSFKGEVTNRSSPWEEERGAPQRCPSCNFTWFFDGCRLRVGMENGSRLPRKKLEMEQKRLMGLDNVLTGIKGKTGAEDPCGQITLGTHSNSHL